MVNMYGEKYEEYRKSVLYELKKEFRNLKEEFDFNLERIREHEVEQFDKKQQMIKALEEGTLNKDDVIQLYEMIFKKNMRRLDIEFPCNRHQNQNGIMLQNSIDECKAKKLNERIVFDTAENFYKFNSTFQSFEAI